MEEDGIFLIKQNKKRKCTECADCETIEEKVPRYKVNWDEGNLNVMDGNTYQTRENLKIMDGNKMCIRDRCSKEQETSHHCGRPYFTICYGHGVYYDR